MEENCYGAKIVAKEKRGSTFPSQYCQFKKRFSNCLFALVFGLVTDRVNNRRDDCGTNAERLSSHNAFSDGKL